MTTWGGKRIGAGRKKGTKNKKKTDIKTKAEELGVTPLEYLLSVMNDPEAEKDRRDRAAIAAARYMHKLGDRNAKEEKDAKAKKAGSGKFEAGKKPQLKAVK